MSEEETEAALVGAELPRSDIRESGSCAAGSGAAAPDGTAPAAVDVAAKKGGNEDGPDQDRPLDWPIFQRRLLSEDGATIEPTGARPLADRARGRPEQTRDRSAGAARAASGRAAESKSPVAASPSASPPIDDLGAAEGCSRDEESSAINAGGQPQRSRETIGRGLSWSQRGTACPGAGRRRSGPAVELRRGGTPDPQAENRRLHMPAKRRIDNWQRGHIRNLRVRSTVEPDMTKGQCAQLLLGVCDSFGSATIAATLMNRVAVAHFHRHREGTGRIPDLMDHARKVKSIPRQGPAVTPSFAMPLLRPVTVLLPSAKSATSCALIRCDDDINLSHLPRRECNVSSLSEVHIVWPHASTVLAALNEVASKPADVAKDRLLQVLGMGPDDTAVMDCSAERKPGLEDFEHAMYAAIFARLEADDEAKEAEVVRLLDAGAALVVDLFERAARPGASQPETDRCKFWWTMLMSVTEDASKLIPSRHLEGLVSDWERSLPRLRAAFLAMADQRLKEFDAKQLAGAAALEDVDDKEKKRIDDRKKLIGVLGVSPNGILCLALTSLLKQLSSRLCSSLHAPLRARIVLLLEQISMDHKAIANNQKLRSQEWTKVEDLDAEADAGFPEPPPVVEQVAEAAAPAAEAAARASAVCARTVSFRLVAFGGRGGLTTAPLARGNRRRAARVGQRALGPRGWRR
ncbi:unnamed protein product, partial [Prorocentrum cordatum]